MSSAVDDPNVRRFLDAAVDPMLIVNHVGAIVLANASAAALFGYSTGEMLKLSVDDLVPEQFRASHRSHRQAYPRQSAPRPMGAARVLAGLHKDGSEIPVAISLSPYDDCVLACVHDMRARLQAEEALRESELRFRATFDLAAVGIAHIAPTGNWLSVNGKLCDILGYPREELLRLRVSDVTPPEDLPALTQSTRRLLKGEIGTISVEKRYIRKDGQIVWASVRVSPVRGKDGRVDYFISVVEDIGQRRQSEAALRELRAEMQELLELNVASQTAKAIAHEINQPLNAMTSYAEAALMMLRAGNPDPDRLTHALERSVQQAQRAGKVARELLQFLQKGDTETEDVDLNRAVCNALAIVESNGFGGFQAELDLEPGLRPVRANRVQVEKVMVNLMRNSVEAMRGAGIATRSIRIAIRTNGQQSMAQVTISDSGPGMDPETARRIFDPFFTTKPRGIGMGLAVSRSLVEAHGGQLWFDSQSGAGASFHFTLPFAP